MNRTYDPKDSEVFDTFVKSFKFLKPGSFEEIIERIKKLDDKKRISATRDYTRWLHRLSL